MTLHISLEVTAENQMKNSNRYLVWSKEGSDLKKKVWITFSAYGCVYVGGELNHSSTFIDVAQFLERKGKKKI